MISYCWSQKQKMRELGRKLKERRIPIWMDVEKMEGNILDCVAKAVEDASVIVVGLSPEYFKSDSCRKECEYAVKLKKQMVFVLAVDGYTPNGWLGLVVGNALYYNPWKNPEDTTSFLKYVARLHEPQTSGQVSNKPRPVSSEVDRTPPAILSQVEELEQLTRLFTNAFVGDLKSLQASTSKMLTKYHAHPLTPMDRIYYCDICKRNTGGRRTLAYTCLGCNFDVCPSCFQKASRNISLASCGACNGELAFRNPGYACGSFRCDRCGSIETGKSYNCKAHKFDLCSDCYEDLKH